MILNHSTPFTLSLILLLYSDNTRKVSGNSTVPVPTSPALANNNVTAASISSSSDPKASSSANSSNQIVTLRPPPYYPELGAGSRIFTYLRLSRKALLGHIIAAWDIEDIYTTKTLKYDLITEYFRIGDCADAPITPKQEISLLNQVRSYELTNVKPWASLAITIRGEDATSGVVDHMTSVIVTHDTTPTGTVYNIEPISVQPNSAQLTWQPPLCESKGGLLYKYDIEMAPVASPINVLSMSSNSEYVSLTDLTPFTRYQIRIRYVNGVGAGPFCPYAVFETTQGPPTAPIIYNFTYDDTSIGVIIVQPVLPNGRIDQYHIQLTGGVHYMSNLYTPLNGTEYVIGNLKPNTTYKIRACARNAAGWGEWSHEIQVSTKFEIKPSPSAIRQTFANKTCIGFHWAPPTKDITAIHSYLVTLSNLGLDKKLLPVSATVNRDSFDHLQCSLSPYTQYSVTVSVVKETGQIGHPLGARMWTEGMVPPKPRPPLVRIVTTSSITVEVFPVIFDSGPITSYELRLLRVLHNHTIKDPHPFGENAFQPNVPLSFLDEEGIGAPPKLQPASGGPALPQRNQVPNIKPIGKRSVADFDQQDISTSPVAVDSIDGNITLWAVPPFSFRHCPLKVWFMEWKETVVRNKDLKISLCNRETLERTKLLAIETSPIPRPARRSGTRSGLDALRTFLGGSHLTIGEAGRMREFEGNETGLKGQRRLAGKDAVAGSRQRRRKVKSRRRRKRSFGSPPGILWLELSDSDLSEATYVTIGDEKMYYGKLNQALEPDTEYGIVFVVTSTVVDVTKHAYVLATTTAFTKGKERELMSLRDKIIIMAVVIPILLMLFMILGFFVVRHLIMAGKEEKRKKESESDDRRKKKTLDDNDETYEESNEDYDMPIHVGDSSDFLSRPSKANSKLEQFFNPTKTVGQPRYITTMRDNIMYDDNMNKALMDGDDNNSADLKAVVSNKGCSPPFSSESGISDLQSVLSDCDCDGQPPAYREYSDNVNNNRGRVFTSPANSSSTAGSHSRMSCPGDEDSFSRMLLPGGVENIRTSSPCPRDEVIKICINGSDCSGEDEADLESSCIDSPPRAYSSVGGYALMDFVDPLKGSSVDYEDGIAQHVPFCPNSLQVPHTTSRTSTAPSVSLVGRRSRSEQTSLHWDVNNNSRNFDDTVEENARYVNNSAGANLDSLGTNWTKNLVSSKFWTPERQHCDMTEICDTFYAINVEKKCSELNEKKLNEKKSNAEIETSQKDIDYSETNCTLQQSVVITALIEDVFKNYSSISDISSLRHSKVDNNNSSYHKDNGQSSLNVNIGLQNMNLSQWHCLSIQDQNMTDREVSETLDIQTGSGSSSSTSDLETIPLNDLNSGINKCACSGLPDSACGFTKSEFSHLPRSPSGRTEPHPSERHVNIPTFRLGESCSSAPTCEHPSPISARERSRTGDHRTTVGSAKIQYSLRVSSRKYRLLKTVNPGATEREGEHNFYIDTSSHQKLNKKDDVHDAGGGLRKTKSLPAEPACKAQRVIDTSHSTDFFRWDFERYNFKEESNNPNGDFLNADYLKILDDSKMGGQGKVFDPTFQKREEVKILDQEMASCGGPCHECINFDQNNNSTRRCCFCCFECKEDDKNLHESESDINKSMHHLPRTTQPAEKARQDVEHEKSLEELANYFVANFPTKNFTPNIERELPISNTGVNSNENNNCDSADGKGCRRSSSRPGDIAGDVKTRKGPVGNGGEGGKVHLARKERGGTNKAVGRGQVGEISESCASDSDESSRDIPKSGTDEDCGMWGTKNGYGVAKNRMQHNCGKHPKGIANILKNRSKRLCSFEKSCNLKEKMGSTKKSVSFVFRKKKRRDIFGNDDNAEHSCTRANANVNEVPHRNTRNGGAKNSKLAEGNLSSNRSPDRALQCRYSGPHVSQSEDDSEDDDSDDSENDESVTQTGDEESTSDTDTESEVEACAKNYTTPNKVTKTTTPNPSPQKLPLKTDSPQAEISQHSLGITEDPTVTKSQEASTRKPPKKRWLSFWPFSKKTPESKDVNPIDNAQDEAIFHRPNHGKDDVQKKPERSMSETALPTNTWCNYSFKKPQGPLFQGSVPGVIPYHITVSPVVYPTNIMPRYPVLVNPIPTTGVPQCQQHPVYHRPLVNMNFSRRYEPPPPTRERQRSTRHASQAHDKVTFQDEFLSLEKYKKHLMRTLSFNVALRNPDKNRFYYILPPDDTRVTVEMVAAGDADYYNASYMDLGGDIQYIAAQTPFSPATVSDFWRLVLQNKVQTIVMMCACVEGGIIKSEQFWASSGVYAGGHVLVETISQVQYADFVVRTLKLTSSCVDDVIVTHFQFLSWPPNGVPDDPIPFLDLRYRVRHYYGSRTTPILVVCGTGAARSAVYIAVDLLIEEYGRNGCVNVYNFVKRMRKSRPFMVRTLSQYRFIYECLFEEFQAGDTVLRTDLREKYRALCQKNPQSDFTFLMDQFRLLCNFTPELTSRACTVAMLKENAMKNVDHKILPPDLYCPYPVNERDVKLTPYINAVVVDGYRRKSEYVITQTPLHNTVFDFWRMVFEFQVQTIVHLGGCRGPNQEQYFPKSYVRQFECLQLQHINTVRSGPVTTRNLKLWITSHSGVEKRAIRHFQVKQWDDHDSLPDNRIDQFPDSKSDMLSLIESVLDWQVVANRRSRPVVVVCRNGAALSGLFVACAVICEKMRENKEVDLYRTVKHIKRRRPQIISDFDQYRFLHQVLWEFIITHLNVDQDVLDAGSQEDDSTIDDSTDSFVEEHQFSCPIKSKAASTWQQFAPTKSKSLHLIENDLSGSRTKMDNLQPVQSRRNMTSKSLALNVLNVPEADCFKSQPSLAFKKSLLNKSTTGHSKFDQSHKKLVIDHLTSSLSRSGPSQQRKPLELSNEDDVSILQMSPSVNHFHQRQPPYDQMVGEGAFIPCYTKCSDWPRQSHAKSRSAMLDQNFDNDIYNPLYTRSTRQSCPPDIGSPELKHVNNLYHREAQQTTRRPVGFKANQQYEFYQQKVSPMSVYTPRTWPRDTVQQFPPKTSRSVLQTSKYSKLWREESEGRDFSKSKNSLYLWPSGHGSRDLSSRSHRSSYRPSVGSRYREENNRRSYAVRSLYRDDDFTGQGSRSESNLKRSRASGLDGFLKSQGKLSLRELDLATSEDVRRGPRRFTTLNGDWSSRNVRLEVPESGERFRKYSLNSWPGTRSNIRGLSVLDEEPLENAYTSEECVPNDAGFEGCAGTVPMDAHSHFDQVKVADHLRRTGSQSADDQHVRNRRLPQDEELEMTQTEHPLSRPLSRDVHIVSSLGSKLFSNTDDSEQANLEFDDFRDVITTKQSITTPGKSLRVSVPHSTPRTTVMSSRVWRNSSKTVNSKMSSIAGEFERKSEVLHDISTRRLSDTQRLPPDKNSMSNFSQPGLTDVMGGHDDVTSFRRNTSSKQVNGQRQELNAGSRTFRRSTAHREDQFPVNETKEGSPAIREWKSSLQVSNSLAKSKNSIKPYPSIGTERMDSLNDVAKSLRLKKSIKNMIPVDGIMSNPSGKTRTISDYREGGNSVSAARYSESVGPSSPDKLVRRQSSRYKSSPYLEIPPESRGISGGRGETRNELDSLRIEGQQVVRRLENQRGAIVVDDFLSEPHVVESKYGTVALRDCEQAATRGVLSPCRRSTRNIQLPSDGQEILVKENSLDLKAYNGAHLSSPYDQSQGRSLIQLTTPARDRGQCLEDEDQKSKDHIVTQFRVCATRNKSPLGTALRGVSNVGGKEKSMVSFEMSGQRNDQERPHDGQFFASSDLTNDRERQSTEMTRAELSFQGQDSTCAYREQEMPPRSGGEQRARSGSRGVISNNSFDESSSPSEYDVSFRIQ